MAAAFGNVALGDGYDPVGCPDGAESVGNDEGGAAHRKGIEGPLDLGFGDGVQSGLYLFIEGNAEGRGKLNGLVSIAGKSKSALKAYR